MHSLTRGMPGDVDLFIEMQVFWLLENKWCTSRFYEMLHPIHDNQKQDNYNQLNSFPFHVFNSILLTWSS